MHAEFLLHAGALLAALALVAWLARRVGQPTIPAFILLGLLLRPVTGESAIIAELSTVGLALLLFFLGIEFSVGALLRDRHRIIASGSIDLVTSFPIGLIAGLALGLGWTGALLVGAGFYISSSAIVARTVIELRRTADPETPLALGILVFEDLFMAVFLALVSGLVLIEVGDAGTLLTGLGVSALFLVVSGAVIAWRPDLVERLLDIENDETFILALGGTVLLWAGLAHVAGVSDAIGAFLAGLAIAETKHKHRAEELLAPHQGVFAALFFFGFGAAVDPALLLTVIGPAAVLTVLGVGSKLLGGWLAARHSGLGTRGGITLGLTLVPRGEFSIVIAGLALSAGEDAAAAMLTLLVLALSLVGAIGSNAAPAVARALTSRRRRQAADPHMPAHASWTSEA